MQRRKHDNICSGCDIGCNHTSINVLDPLRIMKLSSLGESTWMGELLRSSRVILFLMPHVRA